jgi:stage II sporulation protein Q
MYKRRLKSFVLPLIYSIAGIALITSIFFLKNSLDNLGFDQGKNFVYVTDVIFGKDIPVVGQNAVIIRPYNNQDVKVARYYYDYKAEANKQKDSLIYYQNTYMQNSGVDYNGATNFEVVAILEGTVINVNEDNLLGKMVEVRHNNDLISVYQSLSEISVKQGDIVTQGQIIGKSGTCNISPDLQDHLHFEILYKGKVADPETFFDKTIKDL